MDKAIRNTLIIGSSVIVTGVAIYLFVRMAAKKKIANRNFEESGSSQGTGTPSDSATSYNPKKDADYLKSRIQGYGIFKDAYPDVRDFLMALSDEKLVKLNTLYNKSYKESGRSLVQELEHEDAFGECGYDWCYANVVKRMRDLGLK